MPEHKHSKSDPHHQHHKDSDKNHHKDSDKNHHKDSDNHHHKDSDNRHYKDSDHHHHKDSDRRYSDPQHSHRKDSTNPSPIPPHHHHKDSDRRHSVPQQVRDHPTPDPRRASLPAPRRDSKAQHHLTSTDWEKCIICQKDTPEPLTCPATIDKANGSNYLSLANDVIAFNNIGRCPPYIQVGRHDDAEVLKTRFMQHHAKFHGSCRMQFGKNALKIAKEQG